MDPGPPGVGLPGGGPGKGPGIGPGDGPGDSPGGGRSAFDIVVPADKVWVMGDHRSDSADSRLHDDGTGALGSVPMEDIHGKAILIVWPLGRWTGLSLAPDVFAAVP